LRNNREREKSKVKGNRKKRDSLGLVERALYVIYIIEQSGRIAKNYELDEVEKNPCFLNIDLF